MMDILGLRALVLNADYRPLCTYPLSLWSAQDAISAVYRQRVTVVEEWEAVFRSPSTEIKVPKVLALNQYVHSQVASYPTRRSILLRDRFCCQYCGEQFTSHELTFDHVIPRSAGGRTIWENILLACIDCNHKKRNQMPNYSGRRGSDKHGMRPLKEPRRPTSYELYEAGLDFIDQTTQETYADWLYWGVELRA